MVIGVGDHLPAAMFRVMEQDGPRERTLMDVFKGKRVVCFAVPGAFTPTCHRDHLPGYIEAAAAFRSKGVDTIACVSVNDVHVMHAWEQASGASGIVTFLADGNGTFTGAVGMDIDLQAAGMGVRSRRYAMVVDDGVVRVLNIDEAPSQANVASADRLLRALDGLEEKGAA